MNLPIQDQLINSLQRQIPQMLMCEWQSRWYLICSNQFSSTFGLPSQIICGKVHYSVSAESKMIQLETLPLMLQKILQTSHREVAANLDHRELRALAQHYCIAGRLSRNKSDISRRKLKQSLSVREIEAIMRAQAIGVL